MKRHVLAVLAAAILGGCAATGPTLDSVLAGDHRTPAYVERDKYRHPKETLEFFGLAPGQTVVEVWPGRGWYTEILAPYLKDGGQYYAAGFAISLVADGTPQYMRTINADFATKMGERPDLYSEVIVSELGKPERWHACPAGTADLVLTFRNVHNWVAGGFENEMFKAFNAALKPGGTLGVVEHRAKPGTSLEQMKESGYVTEAYVIELAEKAGFKLVGKSEVNANPKDTADHPEGVWTLPPVLRLKDQDREKYLAIGESDRMTLRFVKL
ncbi:MAG: class I SAM-dependent methyltransferase [Gammaproteobacteria bacterium]